MGKKELRAAMNQINKKFGANTVMIVGEHQEELAVKFYPTPSNDINEMLCGKGIGAGKTIEIAGEPGVGKTSLALEIIAHNQKLAKAKGEEFVAGFFETEQSWDSEYAKSLGVDLDTCVYWDQKDCSAEKGLDILISFVNSGQFNCIVINSVSGLLPTKEKSEDIESNNIALTARLMSKLFRITNGPADKNKCSLIFINQLRNTMDQYNPTETTGKI